MQKIMFFDIDGTLIPETGNRDIPESTVKALKLAREAGNLLYVNTGRPAVNVNDDVRCLGFDGYIYGCGTMAVCGDKELYYQTVPKELCRRTVELLRECNGVPMFERRDAVGVDLTMRRIPFVEDIRNDFLKRRKDVVIYTEDEDFSFDKFIYYYDEHTDNERLKKELEKDYYWIYRGGIFAEIVPKPCSKASGIEKVLEYHGIDKSQAYAVGDSLNDLPMFSAVGTSIAMGNGKDLIPHADYVTDDIHADGIYNALEHFGFFDK